MAKNLGVVVLHIDGLDIDGFAHVDRTTRAVFCSDGRKQRAVGAMSSPRILVVFTLRETWFCQSRRPTRRQIEMKIISGPLGVGEAVFEHCDPALAGMPSFR